MKKKLIIMILLCIILIICKYRFSDYTIEYKIDDYNIKEIYKDKRFYYEIKDNEYTYNFDVYMKRSFNKTMITKINTINDETIKCIYPVIKDVKTYPLCYQNGEYTDYNLIDSELLIEYKKTTNTEENTDKDFTYNKNLNKDEYIALWNYKGYIVMNGENYKNIDLFKSDKYDNSLAYMIGDSIYMANNDEEHEYTKLIKYDLTSLKKSEINIGYNIDFDSYIVGNIKNKLYLFDNKYSILYEIDVKKGKTKIVGNNEMGYTKYVDGKFVSCSKTEYKIDKIKYNTKESNYIYSSDGMTKSIKDNPNIKQIINNNNVKIYHEKNNDIYYLNNDNFYKYNPIKGSEMIFYNYELQFNNENTIFVYNK